MRTLGSFKLIDWLIFVGVVAVAAGARGYYLHEFVANGEADSSAISHVQSESPQAGGVPAASPAFDSSRDFFTQFLAERGGGQASPAAMLRWLQVALGALTAGLYFGLGRRAFCSTLVGLVAGLFVALNPFALINVAQLQDGTVTSFLLAFALASGAKAGQRGGALTSILFGLSLAALTLVRLTMAPFTLVSLAWFLHQSSRLRQGWLFALLAFLGFAGGIGSWMGHNYQEKQHPLPIVDSMWWHIWLGNNPHATGGPQDGEPKDVLPSEAPKTKVTPAKPAAEQPEGGVAQEPQAEKLVAAEPRNDQPAQVKIGHEELAAKVLEEVRSEPLKTVERRLVAGLYFFTGKSDGQRGGMFKEPEGAALDERLHWLDDALYCTLIVMLLLGLLGWRWSYAWRKHTLPLQLAIYWIPLPYLLSHAEALHGPRLPLDGVLLTLSAYALCCLVPGLGGRLLRGEPPPDATSPTSLPPPPVARM